ncbi:MAG TPA: ABC transporter substrate-binding protein [Solirubrobacteraceae bacterium]|nr:ABC transporter substrate-binding protein [Solirubrobacteraceae bacterium]
MSTYHVVPRARGLLAFVAILALLALAGCGSSSSKSSSASAGGGGSSSSAASSGSGATSVDTSSCGSKPGVKATGTPINIGTIDTHQPGTDFTDGPNMITAYFNCVNANGGVNGHPLKLYVQLDQSQPSQVAAAAKQLVQGDHVVAINGVFDLLECTINQSYWKSLGIYEMDAGIAPECWSTPNSAAVNMGPRYSSDGAVQYALDQLHAKKIVFVQSNVPGTGYIAAGPAALAKASGVPITAMTENVPITDANSVALNLVNAAGPTGSVVLNFTPPEALVILQAAQKLGLEDRVKSWGCSTPCNTDFLAKALGPKWNHKLFVNAELTDPDDHNGPEMQLYKAILAKYGSSVAGGVGSFSQMGFVLAKFLTQALQTVKGPYTMASVNKAIVGIKNYKTEMLCDPWTYGKVGLHIPNHTDYTTTPENGKMITVQGCFNISTADPQIAQYLSAAKAAGVSTGQ